MYKPRSSIFIVTIILLFSFSCSDEVKPLTNEELKMADSLFRIKEVKLQTSLDSICDSVYKKHYSIMVDSIKKIRQEEVIKLLTN
jgi:hypothetical protein